MFSLKKCELWVQFNVNKRHQRISEEFFGFFSGLLFGCSLFELPFRLVRVEYSRRNVPPGCLRARSPLPSIRVNLRNRGRCIRAACHCFTWSLLRRVFCAAQEREERRQEPISERGLFRKHADLDGAGYSLLHQLTVCRPFKDATRHTIKSLIQILRTRLTTS